MATAADVLNDGYILELIDGTLTALSNAYDAAGRSFERVVPFSGPATWDCEMIAAWATGFRHVGLGTNQHPNPTTRVVRMAFDVKVLVLRCVEAVANDGIPSADSVRSDGESYAIDQWIAVRTLSRALAEGTLFGSCESTRFQRTQEQMPSGGLSGFIMTIEVTV